MAKETVNQRIIRIANSYVGQKEKIRNSGFKNSWFDKLMRAVGFYTGAAWCGFLVKLVYNEAGVDTSLLSGSVRKTMLNATAAKNWHTKPVKGCIAIFLTHKNGIPKKTGHMGIVDFSFDGYLFTIEGNTSEKGSREGTTVLDKHREIDWDTQNGLRLMGFIYPVEVK